MGNMRKEHAIKAGSGVTSAGQENAHTMPEQSRYLLQTKFYVPPVRSNQIFRPRLIDLLNGGMDKTLILVSAPAGYGKSTLVSRWLRETGITSAWLSLDVEDNDPIRFLRYLLTAFHPITPDIENELPDILQPAQHENMINQLINELASICSCPG
jgi:LuxR family maltose regulon positive regulatory protein